MRLLLDEMYPASIAEQLRARHFYVVSVHETGLSHLEGAPDEEVFAAAVALRRAIVTENVPDFRRLEVAALSRGQPAPGLVLTTNRRFPRGRPETTGRLVTALAELLEAGDVRGTVFLREPRSDA